MHLLYSLNLLYKYGKTKSGKQIRVSWKTARQMYYAPRFPALCRPAARLPVGLEACLRFSSSPKLTCDWPDAHRYKVRPRGVP